ncbi:MAG: hypothetical protein ABI614_23520 [Planctomycetota bacterium]
MTRREFADELECPQVRRLAASRPVHVDGPALDPCTPEDIAATIYQILGIATETRIYDQLNRPHSVAIGDPIANILA